MDKTSFSDGFIDRITQLVCTDRHVEALLNIAVFLRNINNKEYVYIDDKTMLLLHNHSISDIYSIYEGKFTIDVINNMKKDIEDLFLNADDILHLFNLGDIKWLIN